MSLLRTLTLPFLYRRLLKSTTAIEARLAEQNSYLKRLADHFAPEPPTAQAEPRFSVDYASPAEIALADAYIARTLRDVGRPPTEEEVERYLAQESIVDLRARVELENQRG